MGTIPTNLVDVANQIRSGDIGLIDVVTIGDLHVSALLGITGSDKKEVTRRPVQAGFQVIKGIVDVPTDKTLHVVLADPDFSVEAGITAAITGSIAGFTDTWRDKKAKLYEMFNGPKSGPNKDQPVVIEEITLQDDVWNNKIITEIEPIFDVNENWACFIGRVTFAPFDNRQQGAIDDVSSAMTSGLQNVGGL